MLETQLRERACAACQKTFMQRRAMQRVCSGRCAARLVKADAAAKKKAEVAQTKARRDELRPLSWWARQAQTIFNAWIRWRDAAHPCISCGTWDAAQWHAGHYLSVGARPELRFDEDNVHKQCSVCNEHKSGNVAEYRPRLIARIGLAKVEALEGPHPPLRYKQAEFKIVIDSYRAALREVGVTPPR